MLLSKYGVYGLFFDGICKYVGSGDLGDRKTWHTWAFKNNRHTKYLQKEYNKYGDFEFRHFAENLPEEMLTEIEEQYKNIFADSILNKYKAARPVRHKQTPEQREEEREKRSKINKGENNPNAKLKEEDVKKIKIMTKYTDYTKESIAKLFNIRITYLNDIIAGRKWPHIEIDDLDIRIVLNSLSLV